ncbi:MAG: hypothetical protein LBQ55_03325 [Treponema sp.]|jgi:hypothetical protein|nr:hypothetical protein [Treponema sp.]
MAHRDDYIPRRDEGFDRWLGNLCRYAEEKAEGPRPQWTHIPAERVAGLGGAYADWHTAYLRTLTPHSPAETLAKNEARAAAEREGRSFVNAFIRYGPISDEERLDCGCRVPGAPRVRDTKPEGVPTARADSSVIRNLTIHFKPPGPRKAKPKGVHGAGIRWAVLDAPPVNETDLANTDFTTASPFTLGFHENHRGGHVYFCLRWESATSIKGDYSEIYDAFIP